jgi:hypothetical protein
MWGGGGAVKFHHAAAPFGLPEAVLHARPLGRLCALALVGWYLMVPPTYEVPAGEYKQEFQLHPVLKVGNNYVGVRDDAPIGQWEIEFSYDTAFQCQTVALRLLKRKPKEWESFEGLEAMRDAFAKCIATDDRRVK